MPFQLSPGVNVSEIDLTTGVPAVSSSVGAIAVPFIWGPAEEVRLIDSEVSMVKTFWEPNNENAPSWFAAANFLSYARALQAVRIISSSTTNANVAGDDTLQIKNDKHYEDNFAAGNAGAYGAFAAQYPGALGNTLKVSMADDSTFDDWEYAYLFDSRPAHNDYLFNKVAIEGVDDTAAVNIWDEMHMVVVDQYGFFTGKKGTILETFPFVSKSPDARSENGSSMYYAEVINRSSQFIRWMDHPIITGLTDGNGANTSNWGDMFDLGATYTPYDLLNSATDYATATVYPYTYQMDGGQNGESLITEADYINAYNMFSNPDEVDVSLIIAGGWSSLLNEITKEEWDSTIIPHIVQLAENRKDAVAFISPELSDILDSAGEEHVNIITNVRNRINSTSYAVADCNWKYQYDKYNDVYRWVPCNGDVAGLCARTDNDRDPWWSPAGYNRGHIKNVVRLAWNPSKAARDELYKSSINPIVTFPGEGTILYGDKTMLVKPSAFDRINVRRLFIVLEKAIAISAKYSLFEFNDAFTRSQFVNMVEPFLRDVQGRRGIYDFKVVCDESNNTGEVIDRNEFIGDIYIKPAKSINFIQLNFVAVRTGVDFSEVVGKF